MRNSQLPAASEQPFSTQAETQRLLDRCLRLLTRPSTRPKLEAEIAWYFTMTPSRLPATRDRSRHRSKARQ